MFGSEPRSPERREADDTAAVRAVAAEAGGLAVEEGFAALEGGEGFALEGGAGGTFFSCPAFVIQLSSPLKSCEHPILQDDDIKIRDPRLRTSAN